MALLAIVNPKTSPTWPLISLSFISLLIVMKTFAPTFNSKHFARPPVSVCQFLPTLSKYSRLKGHLQSAGILSSAFTLSNSPCNM